MYTMTKTVSEGVKQVTWRNGRVFYDAVNGRCKVRCRDLMTAEAVYLVLCEYDLRTREDADFIRELLDCPQPIISKLYAAKVDAYEEFWKARQKDEAANEKHRLACSILEAHGYMEEQDMINFSCARGIYRNCCR